MEFAIAILLAIGVGLATAAQGPTNAALGLRTGAVQAAMVSFAGGLIILSVLSLVVGQGDILAALHVPIWQCFGGIYGAFIVFAMAYCSPSLGVALCLTLFMLGQLTGGIAVDAFGLLGAEVVDITYARVFGCILVFVGIVLVYIGNSRQEKARAAAESAGSAPRKAASPALVVMSFIGGLASAIQTPTNAALSATTGTIEASTLNFFIGFCVLFVVTLVSNKGRLVSMKGLAPWKFTGGVYGAFGVPALTTATPILGVSLALGFLMVSQLVGAIFVDAYGWFEAKKIPVDKMRIVGAIVLGVGVVLVTISKM